MIKMENTIANADFKELAESRKETIELLREKVCNLEGQIDELKKAKESSYSGYRAVSYTHLDVYKRQGSKKNVHICLVFSRDYV